jgi:hypothetical protein
LKRILVSGQLRRFRKMVSSTGPVSASDARGTAPFPQNAHARLVPRQTVISNSRKARSASASVLMNVALQTSVPSESKQRSRKMAVAAGRCDDQGRRSREVRRPRYGVPGGGRNRTPEAAFYMHVSGRLSLRKGRPQGLHCLHSTVGRSHRDHCVRRHYITRKKYVIAIVRV